VTAAEDSNGQNVRGERADALVNASRSLQSRASSVLAAGLMIALGVSALTWYYAHTVTRRSHTRAAAQSAVSSRAQGEMSLPPLGPIVPPAPESGAPAAPPPDLPLSEVQIPEAVRNTIRAATPSDPDPGQVNSAPAKTPAELTRDRRLSGEVFAREPESQSVPHGHQQTSGAGVVGTGSADPGPGGSPADAYRDGGALAVLLRPSATPAAQAQLLPTARFLLPKGAFIDCTLETAIDSTLPGMTTCVTAADTFGADGKVVLLERGSKLVGETRGQVQQGQARVFVVWTQVRTPSGVVVPLDSPGTDELGRSGLPGEVQRHFWQRFGAAMLISIVNGAVQAGVQASNRSGSTVIYGPSTSQDVLTEVLKDTVNIPPTVIKHNGDRIQVLVARDVDFRSVYELRTPVAGR
jgi:type IV secretion system protein VirB10